jgi:hypothetical protein
MRKRALQDGQKGWATRQCTEFVRECLQECHEGRGLGISPRPTDLFDNLP